MENSNDDHNRNVYYNKERTELFFFFVARSHSGTRAADAYVSVATKLVTHIRTRCMMAE